MTEFEVFLEQIRDDYLDMLDDDIDADDEFKFGVQGFYLAILGTIEADGVTLTVHKKIE